jgi:hypothetical protein
MRVFPHFNTAADSVCPICGTCGDSETVLVPIAGKQKGLTTEAVQVHTACILQEDWFLYHEAPQNFIGIPCLYPTRTGCA